MGMTIKTGLGPGFQNHDIKRLFAAMEDACAHLKTFAQIQAIVGGLSMSHLSGETFECQIRLQNFLAELRSGVEPSPADALADEQRARERVERVGNDGFIVHSELCIGGNKGPCNCRAWKSVRKTLAQTVGGMAPAPADATGEPPSQPATPDD